MPEWFDNLLIFGVACAYMLLVIGTTIGVIALVMWLDQKFENWMLK